MNLDILQMFEGMLEHVKRHWDKKLGDVMTCAKIIRGFDSSCVYLAALKCALDPRGSAPWYVAIYESGKVVGLNYQRLNVEVEYDIGFCPAHVLQLSPVMLLLCSESRVVKVSRTASEFVREDVDVPEPSFTFEIPDAKKNAKESFGVFSKTGKIFVYKEGKCLFEVAFPATHVSCFCVIPGDNPVFAAAAPDLVLVSLVKKQKVSQIASIQNVKKMVPLSNLAIALISTFDLRVVQFNKDLGVSSDALIMSHPDEIADLIPIDETTVLGCSGSSAFVCTTDKDRNIVSATLPSATLEIQRVVPIVTTSAPEIPYIAACLCNDGSLALVRVPADKQDRKRRHVGIPIKMELVQLQNYNRCPIRLFASARDQSYLTVSEDGKTVLWESLADWWSAPHFTYYEKKDDPEFLGY